MSTSPKDRSHKIIVQYELIKTDYMDLKVIGIRNAGESMERLLIRVVKDCNLRGYIIIDNTYDEKGTLLNVNRHIYVFPDVNAEEGDIIRVYTKKGINSTTKGSFGKESVLYRNFYWGFDKDITVWNKGGDTPFLLHYDEVEPDTFE